MRVQRVRMSGVLPDDPVEERSGHVELACEASLLGLIEPGIKGFFEW